MSDVDLQLTETSPVIQIQQTDIEAVVSESFVQLQVIQTPTGVVQVQVPGPPGPRGLRAPLLSGAVLTSVYPGSVWPLGRVRTGEIINFVRGVIGGPPGSSITAEIRYAPSRLDAGTVLTPSTVYTDREQGQLVPTLVTTPVGDNYIWAVVSDVSGSPDDITFTFET